MATINDITNASSYRGDPGLGGGVAVGIKIDATPIERLGTFAFYRARDQFELKQKQDAEAAKQIATMTAFDISSPLTPYREALKSQLSEIQDFVRANPNSLVYSRDPKAFQERQDKINKFLTLRKSATASDAIYNGRKATLDKETDPNKRKVLQEELDLDVKDHFAGGIDNVLGTPLKSAADIKPDDYVVPDVTIGSFDVMAQGPNATTTTSFKVVDVTGGMARAEFAAAGIGKPAIDENSEWFKSLSPERQKVERNKASISSTERRKVQALSDEFNGLLQQYKAEHEGADLSLIDGEVQGSDTVTDLIKSVNNYNKQIQEVNGLISAGQLKDPTGKPITRQYPLINVNDGLTPAEVIFLNSLQKAKTPILTSVEKKLQETDDAIQQEQLANQRRGQNLDLLNSREARAAAKKLQEMKDAAGSGEGADMITNAAEYMLGHIQRSVATMKGANAKDMTVPWASMDEQIKGALGFTPDDTGGSYKQDREGNIIVFDAAGKRKSTLNLGILKERIIEQFNGAGGKEAVAAGTLKAVENAFRASGLTDVNTVYKKEFAAKAPAVAQPAVSPTPTTTTVAPTSGTTMTRKAKSGKVFTSTDGGKTWVSSDGEIVTGK